VGETTVTIGANGTFRYGGAAYCVASWLEGETLRVQDERGRVTLVAPDTGYSYRAYRRAQTKTLFDAEGER